MARASYTHHELVGLIDRYLTGETLSTREMASVMDAVLRTYMIRATSPYDWEQAPWETVKVRIPAAFWKVLVLFDKQFGSGVRHDINVFISAVLYSGVQAVVAEGIAADVDSLVSKMAQTLRAHKDVQSAVDKIVNED